MKQTNVKINLTLEQAQELDALIYDSLLRYEECEDTKTRGYKIQKQIAGRMNTALKRAIV